MSLWEQWGEKVHSGSIDFQQIKRLNTPNKLCFIIYAKHVIGKINMSTFTGMWFGKELKSQTYKYRRYWYYIPTVSKLCEFGRTPIVDITPCEGRKPRTPQNEAGILTPPIVSVPEKSIKVKCQMRIPKLEVMKVIPKWNSSKHQVFTLDDNDDGIICFKIQICNYQTMN